MKKIPVLLLLLASTFSFAQAPAPAINPESYNQLKFRYLGPEGNRADSVVGIAGDPLVYYVGAASGGIFKTVDGGVHWDPIFDSQPVSSIGSLAVAPSNPNIVWAGTGEPFIRSHISVGAGIYKSTDAGKTWSLMGLEKTGRIARVEVDPANPNIVLACALGHAYGPQPERGVYRTDDGGKTWKQTLFVDQNTGCSDMAMDPNNSQILFAGMWQIEIHTYGRSSGGPGSGLWRSADGGMTWKKIEGHGLPHPPVGRIAVRVAKNDSKRVYALIETGDGNPWNGNPGQNGQLWRSDDSGENWQLVNSDRNIRGRTHYYNRMEVLPDNENEVYFFSAALSHTLDGGRTLTPPPSIGGGDNHEMWIDPTNGNRMALVHDGGVSITLNRGHSWDFIQLPIAQIYHVTVDDQIPYNVYGNRQDGSSYSGPSNSLEFFSFFGPSDQGGPISRAEWRPIEGGESGFAVPDPVDPNIVWSSGTGSGSVSGATMRYDKRNHQARNVEVWPENVSGAAAGEVKYRFNWEFPLTISPHDHNRVYVGSQFVHMTTDGGNSWKIISPDLSRNDRSRMTISGGLTPDNIGVEYAGVVFAISESPKEAGLLWAGTNDGLLWVKRGNGEWTNVTKNIPGLPEWLTVSNIEASRWDAGTAYISVDGHQMNNRDPWIYRTNDFGRTWTKITNGIPPSMLSYVHCVREDAVRKGMLYAGTENGLYVSFNDGANWQPLQNNLPHSPVYWIANQERFHDLALATYGRGFWIFDDVTPLQQLTPEVLNAAAHLFAPRDAYRYRDITHPAAPFYDPTQGVNPPYGADINIFLKTAMADKDKAKLTISDAAGKVVRTITCSAAKPNEAKAPSGPEIPEEMGGAPKPQPTPSTPGAEQPATLAPLGPTAPEAKAAPSLGERPCELKAGINRVWWDLASDRTTEMHLRTPPFYVPDYPMGPQGWRTAPTLGRMALLVPPGAYSVKLSVGDKDYESQKINVIKDPHSTGTEADVQAQTQFVSGIRDEYEALSLTINRVESIRAQLNNVVKELVNDETGKQIRTSAQQVNDKLVATESKLLQMRLTGHGQDDVRWPPMLMQKLDYLASEVSSSDFAPTTQQVEVAKMLKQQGDAAQQELDRVINTDVANFSKMLQEKGISGVIVKTP